MSQVVSFKLSESDLALLEEHKTNNGITSLGLAAKDLLLKALHEESNLSTIEPYLKEIEERVARTSARGTKAALAVMCLQAAQYDKQMMDHLAQLNAGEVFNFAWDMAGSMVAAGQRPGYYKAAKSADFSTSKNLKKVEAIVELAAESDTLYILKSLATKDSNIKPNVFKSLNNLYAFKSKQAQAREGSVKCLFGDFPSLCGER